MRHLLACLVALLPLPALAQNPTGDARVRPNEPARVRHYRDFLAAWREVLAAGHPEELPRDGAAAMKALCGDEGCPGMLATDFRSHGRIHGILYDEDGGGITVVPDLGWVKGAGGCHTLEPSAWVKLTPSLYLVTLSERSSCAGAAASAPARMSLRLIDLGQQR